jgi:hypothetical protein
MTPSSPQMALPQLPTAPAAPPPVSYSPSSSKPGAKTPFSTFLGSGAIANPVNSGTKTLLGM